MFFPDEPRLDFQVSLRCGAPGNHLVLNCLQETTWTWPPLHLQWPEFYSVKSLQSPLCPVGCWWWPKFSHQLPRVPYLDSMLSFTARTLALTLPSSVWALILKKKYLFYLLFIYLAASGFSSSMWDQILILGIESRLPALETWHLSHWTTRQVPTHFSPLSLGTNSGAPSLRESLFKSPMWRSSFLLVFPQHCPHKLW